MPSALSRFTPFHIAKPPPRWLPAVSANALTETHQPNNPAHLKSIPPVREPKWISDAASKHIDLLWDDKYGTKTVQDYVAGARDIIRPDNGPPRWFSPVECGRPIAGAPVLFFLPGMDGVGLGLTLHHYALGRVFEVWCLHIPVHDRTPFEGLIKLVEEAVIDEHARNPKKPIYIVGDSFGGCLALAVAARNPHVDLVLVLANPASSFATSPLQPLIPALTLLSDELHSAVPYVLSFVMGNPLKLASANIDSKQPAAQMDQISENLVKMLPLLSGLIDIIPKETLQWKLKLIEAGAAYANSRLHAVKAEVLILASGNDNMLPSKREAERLRKSLQNCVVRHFKDNGHTILMEEGLCLLTVIKGTCKYRRSKRLDFISDFIPPSFYEFNKATDAEIGVLKTASCAAMYSTLPDGTIVRGLSGVPDDGPVIFVGYHMLMGLELYSLVDQYLREKGVLMRGIAHPEIFTKRFEQENGEFSVLDWIKVFGAVPVSGANLFKLLASKSHVLLYPGGAREALHYKGEQYKLFWPDEPEFVRMAAKLRATIVPFGVVGEDDIVEYALDYNDLARIPGFEDGVKKLNEGAIMIRDESDGEVGNQRLFMPVIVPKVPGRLYFLFGKGVRVDEREMLSRRENAREMYLRIKADVEKSMGYLLKKREEDPYRNFFGRTVYRALTNSDIPQVPSFEP